MNLRNAFPDKTETEIHMIAGKFFSYFCDIVVETVKSLSISYKELETRFMVPEQMLTDFQRCKESKQSVVVLMGHQGNWEWAANAFGLRCPMQLVAIFKPLHNQQFNKLIYKIRSRFNTQLISSRHIKKDMEAFQKAGLLTATVFLGDQTPSHKTAYWTTFLHQDTPVFLGGEKIAKAMNSAVIYANIKRVKRGYYAAETSIITTMPNTLTPNLITEMFTRKLETDIRAQPETWLWTHRRWKHKRPQP